jgi:hypothetical protein
VSKVQVTGFCGNYSLMFAAFVMEIRLNTMCAAAGVCVEMTLCGMQLSFWDCVKTRVPLMRQVAFSRF